MALAGVVENALLDHALGRTLYVRPAAVYLELFTTAPDSAGSGGVAVPVGAGYTGRLAVANNDVLFPAATQGVKYSGIALPFGTPKSSGWGTLVGVGLYDAQTAGNLLVYFGIDKRVITRSGTPVVLPHGDLYLKFRGGWSDAFANQMLDHLLGGPDYVPPPVWFYGLRADGVELTDPGYARQASQNSPVNFTAAVAGKKHNGSTLVFGPAAANWATTTEFALYTVPTGGSAAMAARMTLALPVLATESTSFDPGDLAFSLS